MAIAKFGASLKEEVDLLIGPSQASDFRRLKQLDGLIGVEVEASEVVGLATLGLGAAGAVTREHAAKTEKKAKTRTESGENSLLIRLRKTALDHEAGKRRIG